MAKKSKLSKILELAKAKDLSGFRKVLKGVLAKKVAKRLDEKELELSKKIFKNGK